MRFTECRQGFPKWGGPWVAPPQSYNFFKNPPIKTDAPPMECPPPLKNEAPPSEKQTPPPMEK